MKNNFLPGRWVDEIDVNDFVNLNKKPFFGEDIFFESISGKPFVDFLIDYRKNKESKYSGEEELLSFVFIENYLEGLDYRERKFKSIFTEEKTFSELFLETSSSDIRKAIKMELLEKNFGVNLPPLFSPDIRQLPLYGVKKIINDKKMQLKRSEGFLQTTDWAEKRIEINRQIEALEKFTEEFPLSMKRSSNGIREVMNGLLAATLYAISENPFVTFHLPTLLHFIDIFIESDLENRKINENEAQVLVNEYYSKLLFIEYYFEKKRIKFVTIETIFSAEPTKTTYRFLIFYKQLKFKFPLMVVPHSETPTKLGNLYTDLIKLRAPIRFLHKRLFEKEQIYTLSHLGFPYRADQDVVLFNKPCDAIKLFEITLNGGKDMNTNHNLFPVKKSVIDFNDFEDFWNSFEKVVAYIFTMYSEANNLIMHLAEKYYSHPFRNSFKNTFWLYKYYFSFTRLDELARYMLGIKLGYLKIDRNTKGYAVSYEMEKEVEDEQLSDMISDIVLMFDEQLARVPFYQDGKANLHYFLSQPLIENERYKYQIPAPEFIAAQFAFNNKARFESYEQVLNLGDKDILDLQF